MSFVNPTIKPCRLTSVGAQVWHRLLISLALQTALLSSVPAQGPARGGEPELSADVERRIELFCGDCHVMPNPASFDRDRWHWEVSRGYEFYAKSGRNDLQPPPLVATLNYFRARAPEKLSYPSSEEAPGDPPVAFKQEKLFLNSDVEALPEIAHLRWLQLATDQRPVLVATDLRYGHVVAIDVQPEHRVQPQLLAQLRNPGRVEVCDLDNDGHFELLVADLASYLPSDHERSRLVMLQRQPNGGYQEVELFTGLGRISDVRAADLDGDGLLDLIIAEFGWRDVGRLLIAKNVSTTAGFLQFELQQIDDRPGALNVRPHDFSGDGRVDIAALYSQEYECLDLFRNTERRYERKNLWTARDLTFGCSGMELVDLNQDGLMDVLVTNGDAFDNSYLSPWHGVQWLENLGDLQFKTHRLTEMPGAYSAQAGDFDGDGLIDIMVSARLPTALFPRNLPRLASIVFLHQSEAGRFDRYTLEWDSPYYPSLAIGDFDASGSLDFAVAAGPYVADLRRAKKEGHYLTVWWNQLERK